jgi:quinol monooxygenase YgiN
MLSHDVFFALRDSSADAVDGLVASCHEHLRDHAGVIFFSVGARELGPARDVNDVAFHVALHIVFEDRAAHDAYQEAPEHGVFIEEQMANWAAVRVFDSTVHGGAGRGD